MSKINKAIKEARKLIKCAKTHEELNELAYKYWGTKNAPIKGIDKVIIMAYMIVERRKELEAGMVNK